MSEHDRIVLFRKAVPKKKKHVCDLPDARRVEVGTYALCTVCNKHWQAEEISYWPLSGSKRYWRRIRWYNFSDWQKMWGTTELTGLTGGCNAG